MRFQIAKLRARRGLSQSALARAVKCHRQTISNLERGIKTPSLSFLTRLAKALRCDVRDLIG